MINQTGIGSESPACDRSTLGVLCNHITDSSSSGTSGINNHISGGSGVGGSDPGDYRTPLQKAADAVAPLVRRAIDNPGYYGVSMEASIFISRSIIWGAVVD